MLTIKNCLAAIVLLSFSMNASARLTSTIVSVDTIPSSDSNVDVFDKVEKEAEFNGGEQAWRTYLEQNLNPNTPVERGAPEGTYTVWIQFIVDLDGSISNIKALTKNGYGMETEVMRIIRKAPSWTPAMIGDKPVKAYRKQPVTFVVQVEKRKRRNRD